MNVYSNEFYVHNLRYLVRSAVAEDAKQLSEVRLPVDGETENLDREPGEGLLFTSLILN